MKLKNSVVYSKIENEGVLFDQDQGSFFSLNEVAARMIEIITNNNFIGDADDIAKILISEYDVDEAVLLADIRSFLKEITEKGFLCE